MSDTRPYDVLIVGEVNVDILLTGDVTPTFGQVEKLVDDLSVAAGGSAAIFCAGAARMGLRLLFASQVGDDAFGHYMRAELAGAGVDITHVLVNPALKTGATVLLSRGQDRAMLTYLGSMAALTAELVAPEWYSQVRHLHVASPFLLTALRPGMPAMMRAAKEAGLTVSLDTNWDPAERWDVADLFAHLDVFLPNEQELCAITGCADVEEAVEVMRARVPVLVVKRGAQGALAVRGVERVEIGAFPVRVVDTTGAGDSFDAGFLAGWLRGKPLRECLQLGAACGALTATIAGGFNGQPTWEEAQAFIHAHGQGAHPAL
jgi:sugar/nucleoside kinase (ribokinase family)